MLLVITERDSYCYNAIEHIFEVVLTKNIDEIYVLVHPDHGSPLTVSSLIDQLANIYDSFFQLTSVSKEKLNINVLLYDEKYDPEIASQLWTSVLYTDSVDVFSIPKAYIEHVDKNKIHSISTSTIECTIEKHRKYRLSNPESTYESIPVVAVGGTFDHLHDGHKILLTVSAFLTGRRLIVGVTGPGLLGNKKYVEYMESFEIRVRNVNSFVKIIKPGLFPDIYEINDVCGPTAQVESIDALVVSLESYKGAEFVNNKRRQLGWKPLDVYTIGVLGGNEETFNHKMSSTDYRKAEYLRDHADRV